MRILSTLLFIAAVSAQVLAQSNIQPPAAGKSVVYFVRTSSIGMAINFTYLDSAKLIGRFAGPAYTRYECEPGHHLFWARSENRDYVEAELAPDQTYFIQANVVMGAIKAQVDLVPVNPATDQKEIQRIFKLMDKQEPKHFTESQLESDSKELAPIIERGLKTYEEEQQRGVQHDVLPAAWSFNK
ncbi:MAG: hypothetical protein ACKO1U_01035 [Bacteroidota bacterium]